MKKLNNPLTNEELKLLSETSEGQFQEVFPNHSRQFLRSLKRDLRGLSIEEQIALDRNIIKVNI